MSCHPRVTEWTLDPIRRHMPHLSKPQATVLALWSLGMVLARSCALTAVSAFLATWLGRKEPAVRQQLREFCYEATPNAGRTAARSRWNPALCRCWAGSSTSGRARNWPWPLTPRDLGHTFYRLGDQCGVSGLCHPGGLDRPGGHRQTCLAAGVVAHAAAGAPGGSTLLDGPGAGRSGLVRPLAVSAHHPAGMASVFAHQHRRHLSAHGPRAWAPLEDVGARARHDVAGAGHRFQRP